MLLCITVKAKYCKRITGGISNTVELARRVEASPHLDISEERDSWRDLSHVFLRRRCGCGLSLSSVAVSRSHRPRDLVNVTEHVRRCTSDGDDSGKQ